MCSEAGVKASLTGVENLHSKTVGRKIGKHIRTEMMMAELP